MAGGGAHRSGAGKAWRSRGRHHLSSLATYSLPDLLGAQGVWGSPEMAREPEQRNLLQVRGLGLRREVPDLHVLGHALPKGGHGALLYEEEVGWAAGSLSMFSQRSADGKRLTEG